MPPQDTHYEREAGIICLIMLGRAARQLTLLPLSVRVPSLLWRLWKQLLALLLAWVKWRVGRIPMRLLLLLLLSSKASLLMSRVGLLVISTATAAILRSTPSSRLAIALLTLLVRILMKSTAATLVHAILATRGIVAATASEAWASRRPVARPVGSLVNSNGTSVEFYIIHGRNGRLGFAFLGKAHKAKTTAATGIAILDHHSLFHGAKLFKLGAQGRVIRVPGQATNEYFGHD